jgi:ferredoxin
MKPYLKQELCRPHLNAARCQACLKVCPVGMFLVAPVEMPIRLGVPIAAYDLHVAQSSLCLGCGRCVQSCPGRAIEVR